MDKTPEDSLNLRLRAQRVDRYHAADITERQTVGEHTYGCAQILRYLTEGKSSEYRLQCLEAMLDHDVPEALMGDVPHPVKRDHPKLVEELHKIEEHIYADYHLSEPLSPAMEIDCACADLLEMAWFGYAMLEKGNQYGSVVVGNVVDAFSIMKLPPKAEAMLCVITELLGVDSVSE